MLIIRNNCSIFKKICHFYLKEKKVNKVEKLICNTEDKEKYVMHIKVFKQASNHGLVFKKGHRVIQFNKKKTG